MFKKGNIVRFKCGFWGDTNDPETGKLGVIEYSYGEKFGNGNIYGGYSVLDKETGGASSWWDEDKLEFVSEGSLDEIEKCYVIKKENTARHEDLNFIRNEILNGNTSLSGTSILKLFHEIGYTSAFERNGEFYALTMDWISLNPIFVALFNNEYNKMIDYINNVFKEKYRGDYVLKATEFFHKING